MQARPTGLTSACAVIVRTELPGRGWPPRSSRPPEARPGPGTSSETSLQASPWVKPAVADRHDAIGDRADERVVGHDQERPALGPRQVAEQGQHAILPLSESRLPVGSSARITAAGPASARATATRWRWPPERSRGRKSLRSPRPTASSTRSASRRAFRPAPALQIQGVLHVLRARSATGNRLNCWKTKPIERRRTSRSCSGRFGIDHLAVDDDAAAGGGEQAAQDAQERRLARARGPIERHHLAPRQPRARRRGAPALRAAPRGRSSSRRVPRARPRNRPPLVAQRLNPGRPSPGRATPPCGTTTTRPPGRAPACPRRPGPPASGRRSSSCRASPGPAPAQRPAPAARP